MLNNVRIVNLINNHVLASWNHVFNTETIRKFNKLNAIRNQFTELATASKMKRSYMRFMCFQLYFAMSILDLCAIEVNGSDSEVESIFLGCFVSWQNVDELIRKGYAQILRDGNESCGTLCWKEVSVSYTKGQGQCQCCYFLLIVPRPQMNPSF